jgi:hypothetical protein
VCDQSSLRLSPASRGTCAVVFLLWYRKSSGPLSTVGGWTKVIIYFLQTVLLFFSSSVFGWMSGVGLFSSTGNNSAWSICPKRITPLQSVLLPASYLLYSCLMLIALFLGNLAVWSVRRCHAARSTDAPCWRSTHGFNYSAYVRTLLYVAVIGCKQRFACCAHSRSGVGLFQPCARTCAVSGLLQTCVVLLTKTRVCYGGFPPPREGVTCVTLLVGGAGLDTSHPDYMGWAASIAALTVLFGLGIVIFCQWCARTACGPSAV